jgi:hypothetical protein
VLHALSLLIQMLHIFTSHPYIITLLILHKENKLLSSTLHDVFIKTLLSSIISLFVNCTFLHYYIV